MISLTDEPLNAAKLHAVFERAANGAGGLVTFTGLVRATSESEAVSSLYLQAYSPVTENGMQHAVDDAKRRWPLEAVRVVHRIGDMYPGDTIVFVATASRHRRAAFEAADFIMDYMKTKAVFWKKETRQSGEYWIEPRAEDYQDDARWTKS